MVQPVSHGYPDYGRFQAQSDKLLDFQINETTDGLVVRNRIFVGDIPFIGLNLQAIVNSFEFQCFFYQNPSGGALLSQQFTSVRQGSVAEFAIPIGGPWLEFRIAPNTTGSEYTFLTYSAHSPLRNISGTPGNAILLSNLGTVIGAGLTDTVTTTQIMPGECHWFATFVAGVSFRIRLLSIDIFGSRKLIDYVDSTSPPQSRQVFLPAMNVQIESFNNDASGRQLVHSLVTRPIAQGF